MRKSRAEIEEKTVQNFLDAELKKLIMLFEYGRAGSDEQGIILVLRELNVAAGR